MATTTDMRAAVAELPRQLDERRWDSGVKIVLQGAMRAPIVNGNIELEASWRADVFYGGRRAAFTLVAETPQQVLRDLADFIETPPIEVAS